MRMLIADDNEQILTVLQMYAQQEGFQVDTVTDGNAALAKALAIAYDVILLDVMMPQLNGFDVCKKIRVKSMVPIIMVTARSEDYDRIMGLDIGADSVVKPFSPGEVMARVRAVLRRADTKSANTSSSQLSVSNLMLYMDEGKVSIGGCEVVLTKKELELLWTLVSHPDKIFSRDSLLDRLWGADYYGDKRTVDSHVKRMRDKLDVFPHHEWSITTVWGMGYKFEELRNEE